jgi:glycosyltransferase involved in cell wall biosynthesis
MPRFLMGNRIDVFHTQYILPVYVPRRTRVFTHIHDVSFERFPEYVRRSDRFFLSLCIPRTMRRSDRIIVPSEFTRREVMETFRVPEERIAVVRNAVEERFRAPVSSERILRVREAYGLPERFVLSVGTMQPRKDIPTLIRAFASVADRLPDMMLVLAGRRGGYHYDTGIDGSIAESGLSGRILFPGYVDDEDLPALFASARLLVFPSRYEGFGLPILEAFSAGVPVVASDIPPFREVGDDAIAYFDPGTIATLSEEMYTLLTDERRRRHVTEKGRERSLSFSWERSAALLSDLYRDTPPS